MGDNCVVGNSTELKNVIIFNNVQVPHYNYVGDSILGFHSHMGAGSITSNVKSDKTLVHVKGADFDIATGMKKFGAMLGDYVEVGCNSVLNPGTVIGSHSNIYPLSRVRGYVPSNSIYKVRNDIVTNHESLAFTLWYKDENVMWISFIFRAFSLYSHVAVLNSSLMRFVKYRREKRPSNKNIYTHSLSLISKLRTGYTYHPSVLW